MNQLRKPVKLSHQLAIASASQWNHTTALKAEEPVHRYQVEKFDSREVQEVSYLTESDPVIYIPQFRSSSRLPEETRSKHL
jgi:hypothetical protein